MKELIFLFTLALVISATTVAAYHKGIQVGVERVATNPVVVKRLDMNGVQVDYCMNYYVWDRCVPFTEWEALHAKATAN